MKYFVFRNQTVEPFLGDKDIAYSGYGDISFVPQDASKYIWFYQIPINTNEEQLASEIGEYFNMLQLVVSLINENKDILCLLWCIYSVAVWLEILWLLMKPYLNLTLMLGN